MSCWARRAEAAAVRLRLGKGRSEAQLHFADGSYLHIRHDHFSRWLQAGNGGVAAELAAVVSRFEYRRGRVKLCFEDESVLEAAYRWRRLLLRARPPAKS